MSRARKALRQEAYEASAKLDREWLARGGSMRTIFTEAVQYDTLAWAFTRRPISEGGLVRLSPALPMQLLIVDREVAIVQVDPKDSSAGALFISVAYREPGHRRDARGTWGREPVPGGRPGGQAWLAHAAPPGRRSGSGRAAARD